MESTQYLIEPVATSGDDAPQHPNGPGSVEIDPQGGWALTRDASGADAKPPLTWDLNSGTAHSDRWLRLAPAGRGLRREADDRIALADIRSGETICTLEDVQWPSSGPRPSPDGAYAAASLPADAADKARPAPSTDIWSLRDGKRIARIDTPLLLGVMVAGERLVAMDAANVLTVWDLASGERAAQIKGPRGRPVRLRVDAAGQRAVSIDAKGEVVVWDLAAAKVAARHDALAKLRGGPPPQLCLLHGGRRLLAEGRFLDVLDLDSGALDRSWEARDPNRDDMLGLAPLDDGGFVAVLMSRGLFDPTTLEIWNVDSQQQVAKAEVPDGGVFAVTPNGRVVVAGEDELASLQLRKVTGRGSGPPRAATKKPAAAKKSPAKKKSPAVKKSAAKKKSPAVKKPAAKKTSPAKKKSAAKKKSPAKKKSAAKKKSPAKKKPSR